MDVDHTPPQRGVVVALIVLAILVIPSLAGAESTDEVQAYRAGDLTVSAGPSVHSLRLDAHIDSDAPLEFFPGFELSAKYQSGEFIVFTARTGLTPGVRDLFVPAMVSARVQLQFGSSAVTVGPGVGLMWHYRSRWAAIPAVGLEAGYEYRFDNGFSVGVQADTGWIFFVSPASRAVMTAGYTF